MSEDPTDPSGEDISVTGEIENLELALCVNSALTLAGQHVVAVISPQSFSHVIESLDLINLKAKGH